MQNPELLCNFILCREDSVEAGRYFQIEYLSDW